MAYDSGIKPTDFNHNETTSATIIILTPWEKVNTYLLMLLCSFWGRVTFGISNSWSLLASRSLTISVALAHLSMSHFFSCFLRVTLCHVCFGLPVFCLPKGKCVPLNNIQTFPFPPKLKQFPETPIQVRSFSQHPELVPSSTSPTQNLSPPSHPLSIPAEAFGFIQS